MSELPFVASLIVCTCSSGLVYAVADYPWRT